MAICLRYGMGRSYHVDDVLIVHDAVVVDEIWSIMRKDIIYQVERIHSIYKTLYQFSLRQFSLFC